MRIHLNSWLARYFLSEDFVAITIGKHIFVKGAYTSQAMLLHEYKHVLQYEKLGLKYFYLYLYYQFKYGYENNPFEIEARAFANMMLTHQSVQENEIFLSQVLT